MSRAHYVPVSSSLEGIAWPGIPNSWGQKILALLYQLQESEWQPREWIERRQYIQASRLASYAARTVPFYRERLAAAGISLDQHLKPEQWRKIPVLTRDEIQVQGNALASKPYPARHGKPSTKSTSGSTGKPVSVVTTELSGLFWSAISLRDHVWHKRDLSKKLAAIRKIKGHNTSERRVVSLANWGPPASDVFDTGPGALLGINTAVEEQLKWLLEEEPAYLLTYPTNLQALLDLCRNRSIEIPGLNQVRTMAEIVSPVLREQCREVLNIEISDMYSSQECGYFALQSPGNDSYLVQAEAVLLEVLHEDGSPCAEGETGRVVVTPLTNFAMPLLRYEIGDYATIGGPSPCGRGLPVLDRILGRVRNMLVKPDGQRIWPSFGTRNLAKVAPISQYQFIQQSRTVIEARFVLLRPLVAGEEEALLAHLHQNMPAGIDFALSYVDHIQRSEGGKYEDFLCRVDD